MATDDDSDLVRLGRVALLETRGRTSGQRRRAQIGFVRQPDGSLLVAASDPDTDWALNLLAEPSCRVTIGAREAAFRAELLDGDEQATAVRELILRYGTPSERLGGGPAFRLRPRFESDGGVSGMP